MKKAGDETLTSALSLYSSFPCCFEAIDIEQQPHKKICSHVRLLHSYFYPSVQRNLESMNLLLQKKININTTLHSPLCTKKTKKKNCSSCKLTLSESISTSTAPLNCNNCLSYLPSHSPSLVPSARDRQFRLSPLLFPSLSAACSISLHLALMTRHARTQLNVELPKDLTLKTVIQ